MRVIQITALFLITAIASIHVNADQTDPRLDKLFFNLKVNTDLGLSQQLTSEIWRIWSEHNKEDINILFNDGENAMYWIKYADLNKRLNFFEEAEHGYRRAIELGNYEESTWISRADILLALGEIDAIISNLNHGLEFYPEQVEMEYRLAGAYYKMHQDVKARFHLQNALKTDPEFIIIIEELFPEIIKKKEVKDLIVRYTK